MTRAEAKEHIKTLLIDYLERTTQKKGKAYFCPFCGSGTGKNKTPALFANGEQWQCFSCKRAGDIYNYIAELHQIDINTDFATVLDIAIKEFNLIVDNTQDTDYKQYTHIKHKAEKPQETAPTHKTDYTAFLKACKVDADKTDYFINRGLEKETIERFNLGFITAETISQYKEACSLDDYLANYIVIPYNKGGGYWIARSTQTEPNGGGAYKWRKPKTENAGKEPVYNEAEIDRQSVEPIFITEAPIDSMSIMQAGGAAIATGGTGQDKIEKALESRPDFSRIFIIAYDNDNAGAEATERLKTILEAKGKQYILFEYPANIKDCNAYLMADKGGFYKTVQEYIEQAKEAIEEEKERAAAEYNKDTASERLKDFIEGMRTANTPPTPTGFRGLDNALDGGLYEGLYIVGAISSLGKTTLILQIADQIANSGQDVLIFSLEMAAAELMAKSISRETLLYCRRENIAENNAKTVRGITDQSRHSKYSNTEKETINGAITAYRAYAKNIVIKQGLGDIGIKEIKETIEQHKAARGQTPIIIIDYLQILAPYNDRASDKQNTDKAVLELKRISRDYKTPVIAISSFNRDNYSAAATMTAFKESGAIEYSSDILIALQPQGMRETEKDGDKAENRKIISNCKANKIRDIEAVILKNRNGATGGRVGFSYNSLFNYFEESTPKSTQNTIGTIDI